MEFIIPVFLNCPTRFERHTVHHQEIKNWVEQLRNIGIINSTTRSHLVGYFYKIYIKTLLVSNTGTCNSYRSLESNRTPVTLPQNTLEYVILHPGKRIAFKILSSP